MLPSLPASHPFSPLVASGKWLRVDGDKWNLHGVSYGPFRPREDGASFPAPERLAADFQQIRRLGFNTVRLYDLPTEDVLEGAEAEGLRLLVGIPWTDHVDFMHDGALRQQIEQTITDAARRFRDVPCVAGFLVGNEIEKNLARWMEPGRVRRFLEGLIEIGRREAPAKLFSYATYPSTEYLVPSNVDFLAVNLYLEHPAALESYLQRLQNLAGDKPLVITEFGLDVAAHGEQAQAETRAWFHRLCHRNAVAGTVWFSFTDEWFRGGDDITRWSFGLVTTDRQERAACHLDLSPGPLVDNPPRISVVVCTWNGGATLADCLSSLQKLRYPNFEVLLIDDGSTQDIAAIAHRFPSVLYVRQDHAGLSVARNRGASLATGEIVAYTDDDCIADEDWLTHLATGFDDPQWVAAGGPNIPPRPRNRTEAVVAAAPGAPAHVLLNDIEAEHLPGCNLAIRKRALEAIGGFQAQYVAAGDDVDVCWRLQQAGGKLRFVPGAMVWHHRRYSIQAYFRQQAGYGRAEALLMKDHPERFGALGGARWIGGIYGDRAVAPPLDEGSIYHGPQGEGLFQGIYRQGLRCWLDWTGGVIWVALVLGALVAQCPSTAAVVIALSWLQAAYRQRLLTHPPFSLGTSESLLLLGLCWIQPVVREWKRLVGMVQLGARPAGSHANPPPNPVVRRPSKVSIPLLELCFWNEVGVGRTQWLDAMRRHLAQKNIPIREDQGWRLFDLEAVPHHIISPAFLTVTEYHGERQRLTRIKLLMRIQWRLIFGVTALLGLVGLLAHPHPLLADLATLSILGLSTFIWALRQRFKRMILDAAKLIGLEVKS
ncbi:glycosyltransferase [Prosthecobacter debontii]|nr:glycosyltransferase [Prosthecobacter debontii]